LRDHSGLLIVYCFDWKGMNREAGILSQLGSICPFHHMIALSSELLP